MPSSIVGGKKGATSVAKPSPARRTAATTAVTAVFNVVAAGAAAAGAAARGEAAGENSARTPSAVRKEPRTSRTALARRDAAETSPLQ